jgi:hypothetical protein
MSEVRLIIREVDRDWSGTVHGSTAHAAVAALSADPTTFAELESALARYEKPLDGRRLLPCFHRGLNEEPWDAGIVILDLAARLVVIDSTYSCPGPTGEVDYHDGRSATKIRISYHLAEDWLFTHDIHSWHFRADKRRNARAAHPPIDVRAVLFGRPLVEFIAREVFAAFQQREPIAPEAWSCWINEARSRIASIERIDPTSPDLARLTVEELHRRLDADDRNGHPYYDTIKDIHARWLMTPRDDLRGATPREASLEQTQHLSWDLQDQEFRWSFVREAPPRLDPSSHAYRFAGFGIHEQVEYYYLTRQLLWTCWDGLAAREKSQSASPTGPAGGPWSPDLGDFLTAEVPRLETAREAWLDAPDPQSHSRTPRSIIECERIRLPLRMGAKHAMVDPDCPCCRMAAEGPVPMFWHLDGCNMDDQFAFDIYHRTLAEREQKEREREEFNRDFNRRMAIEAEERNRLGLEGSRYKRPDGHSVWSRSYTVGESADLPLGIRLFDLGGQLAELITDLRSKPRGTKTAEIAAAPDPQPLIDRLNQTFDNFRAVLDSEDLSLAATLIQPVIDAYADALAEVGAVRPDLAEKCEWIANDVNEFLRPPPPPDSGYPYDLDDSDDES